MAVELDAVALDGSMKQLLSEAKETAGDAVGVAPSGAVIAASYLRDAGSFKTASVLEIGEPAFGAASVDALVVKVSGVVVAPEGGRALAVRPPSNLAAFNRNHMLLPGTTPVRRR